MYDENEEERRIPLIDGVDVREGLARVSGNKKVYWKLLRSFANENYGFIESFVSALQAGDGATAGLLVHSLKGIAGNLGARELFRLLAALEKELRSDPMDRSRVEFCFQDAASELNRVMDAAGRALQEDVETFCGMRTPFRKERIAPLVSRLEFALQQFDTCSSDILDELEEAWGGAFDEERLKRIRDLVNAFEYESAFEEVRACFGEAGLQDRPAAE